MNRQQAHRHPSLPDPCEVCDPTRPLAQRVFGNYDEPLPLLTIVGGVIGLLCFGVVLWFLIVSLG